MPQKPPGADTTVLQAPLVITCGPAPCLIHRAGKCFRGQHATSSDWHNNGYRLIAIGMALSNGDKRIDYTAVATDVAGNTTTTVTGDYRIAGLTQRQSNAAPDP